MINEKKNVSKYEYFTDEETLSSDRSRMIESNLTYSPLWTPFSICKNDPRCVWKAIKEATEKQSL